MQQECNLQVNEFQQQNPENAVVMMMMMIRRDAVSPEFLDIAVCNLQMVFSYVASD
jgi:hypothetical protein